MATGKWQWILVTGMALTAAAQFGVAQVKGVANSGGETEAALERRIAALELRVKQLEGGQAAIRKSLGSPAATADDVAGAAKSSGRGSVPGAAGGGNGAADGATHEAAQTLVVRAPFIVVDHSGKTVFRVEDPATAAALGGNARGAYVYDETGQPIFGAFSKAGGGKVFISTGNGSTLLTMAAWDTGIGMQMKQGAAVKTYIGIDGKNQGLIQVFGADGKNPAAGLATEGAKGVISVYHNGTAVAYLTESSHAGGGNVTLTNPGGSGVFSAGYDGDQGAACVNRKSQLHCLGIGLPMAGN